MSKHTEGPWRVGRPGPNGCQTIGTHGGLMVAVITHSLNDPPHREQAIGNARLIAAAPDMLEALRPFAEVDYEELIGAPDDMPIEEALYKEDQPTVGDLRRAMEALAKAEGRS